MSHVAVLIVASALTAGLAAYLIYQRTQLNEGQGADERLWALVAFGMLFTIVYWVNMKSGNAAAAIANKDPCTSDLDNALDATTTDVADSLDASLNNVTVEAVTDDQA